MDDVVFFATLRIGNLLAEPQNYFHVIEINVKVKGIPEQNKQNNKKKSTLKTEKD